MKRKELIDVLEKVWQPPTYLDIETEIEIEILFCTSFRGFPQVLCIFMFLF